MPLKPPTAVILAGGLGTRIRHLLDGLPKPLAPVAGRPFLEWVIRFYARQGIANFVISAGYRAEMIEAFCAEFSHPGVRVRCRREDVPLGTAGGFLNAIAGEPSETWMVCNGDSLACTNLTGFLSVTRDAPEEARLLALDVADTGRYGNLKLDERGFLAAFNEKVAGRGLINAGVYLFRESLLRQPPSQRPLSFETDWFPALLKAGKRIRVDKAAAPFIDIGTESSLREAEAFVTQNQSYFL